MAKAPKYQVEMAAAVAIAHAFGAPIQCNGCGACCKAFYQPTAVPINPDSDIATKLWQASIYRVKRDDVRSDMIQPHRTAQKIKRGANERLFACSYHDGQKCTTHETRPRVCSAFPFYGADPMKCLADDPGFLDDYPACTYRLALGKPVEELTED